MSHKYRFLMIKVKKAIQEFSISVKAYPGRRAFRLHTSQLCHVTVNFLFDSVENSFVRQKKKESENEKSTIKCHNVHNSSKNLAAVNYSIPTQPPILLLLIQFEMMQSIKLKVQQDGSLYNKSFLCRLP
jgi:hypothetical protein